MKHTLYVLITLLITSPCTAMEIDLPKTNILKELTSIKNPERSIYLTENHIVVLSDTKCSIVDVTTDTEIKKLFDRPRPNLSANIELHPHKTKIAFFYHTKRSCDYKIAIYDTQSYHKEWSKKIPCNASISRVFFNPLDDTIAVRAKPHDTKIHICNYKTGTITAFDIHDENENINDCAEIMLQFHPTKPLMCIVRNGIYIVDTLHYSHKKTVHLFDKPDRQRTDIKNLCAYSPNGSHMAVYESLAKTVHIINSNSHNMALLTKCLNPINTISFFSNGVLVLLYKNNTLEYWDIIEKKVIQTTSTLNQSTHFYRYPSVSPNGKEVMLTCGYRSVIFPVLFEILNDKIYQTDAKQKSALIHVLFKHYQIMEDINLPNDIALLIAQNYFELCKR